MKNQNFGQIINKLKNNKINIEILKLKGFKSLTMKRLFGGFDAPSFINPLWLMVIVLFTSCEEQFWPELGDKYENILVVEGMITSETGPYTVILSLSTSVERPVYSPLSDYEAIINDDLGNSEILSETEPGVYQSAVDGIQGIVGRKYQLIIQSPQGKTYNSGFEELRVPVGIDSIYIALDYRENSDFPFDIPGYQFYLNTNLAANDSSYYLWKLERTYEYHADFRVYFWFDGELHTFPDTDSIKVCWKTDPVYQIFTGSTVGLDEPVITDFPLQYVSFDNREFSVRYSLLINQLTISEQAQEYWKRVNEQNTSGGELYTKMPYQVRGNINNIDNLNEPVLGYFQAAGVDTKRVFFNRPEYQVKMYYPVCELHEADYLEYALMLQFPDPRDWPQYVTMNTYFSRAVPVQECVDCRENGGIIEKPEFWIDL